MSHEVTNDNDVAIIGMAARLPDAASPDEFWQNVERGVESVRVFSDRELSDAGVPVEELVLPGYVKSGVVLADFDGFDAEFFGFSPKEAAIMDPQHRQFLECAWEALEDAGHPPESFAGSVGLFAGSGMGAYFAFNLLTNRDLVNSVGLFLLRHTGNDKDFLTTRVSYCLDLRGPSVNVQTACSTSLVATHMACQSLLSGECDMALAGGVTVEIPHRRGYLYQPGEILSPDGHCRAFDRRAAGTIFGSGAGVVVLRRLADALRDGDAIHAVIKGSAVNNDGAAKVGYLAPSVDGQAAAVAEALAVAGVSAESLRYVECHGTGTAMGDPIEIAALTQAFRKSTQKKGFCAVGSVKTNIGHLDTAAGVASLIKASMAIGHGKLPPSLNYEAPNPEIPFDESPFFVNRELTDWPSSTEPRRAGVNSLGVGGTNAFVVLEEAPRRAPSPIAERPYQLLTVSARNRSALDAATARLAAHLGRHPEVSLADVAYTLHVGRRAFTHRRVVAARDHEEATFLLGAMDPRRVFSHVASHVDGSLAFMFPGGGSQYVGMAKGLYASEQAFRHWIDRGLELLRGEGEDLSPLFLPSGTTSPELAERFERPSSQLPAIFLVEYALARLWMNWGIEPKALIGHSMGENTAACVAGVFRFEDALRLVHLRGRLMDEVPEGGMLSVALSAKELEPLLGDDLDLASANAPELSVASGPREALEALGRTLAERGVEAKWVRIRIAAHSRMLEPVLGRYGDFLRGLALAPPKIPVVSNVSGTFLTASEATCPDYWTRHLRSRVRFAEGIATLAQDPGRAFLEVGPGRTLSSLARQHPDVTSERLVLASLGHPDESIDDAAFVLTVFGRLWAAGLPVDLAHARGPEARRLARLPTYPFQHQRYFIEPGKVTAQTAGDGVPLRKVAAIDDWFYRPVWRPAEPLSGEPGRRTWLVFIDDAGLGAQLTHALRERGDEVVVVHPSDAYYQLNHNEYRLSPEHGRDGYDALVRDLVASGKVPDRVVHLWLVAANEKHRPGSNFFHRNQERGFYSLLFLAQALADQGTGQSTHLTVVSSGMQQVGEEGVPFPDQATVLGPCKVIPHEIPRTTCASVDIVLPQVRRLRLFETKGRAAVQAIASQLMLELSAPPGNRVVALREGNRFEQTYEPMSSHEAPLRPVHVRAGGTYVVTGGLGGIGLTLARHLASLAKVNLVLVARKGKDGPDRGAAVRELESLGAEVLVVASDVTDPERMKDGLAEARRRFGKLHGVIHAAGMLSDELLQAKTQAQIENVFAPKVYGTLVLDALLSADDLDFFFLFSSTSVASGPVGQIDYVAANAFLNAYAEGRGQRLSRRTTAIGWGIWNGVGMAAESVKTLGERPARQSAAERPVSHPLFHSRTTEGGDERFWGRLSPATDWVLDEHRTSDGRAVVPGTAYLEMIAATLAEVGVSTPFEVQDLLFMRPMAVADDRIVELWATLRKSEQGYDFEVHSKVEAVRGDGSELHAQAKIVLGVGSRPAPEDLDALADRCSDRAHHDPNGILSGQEKHMRFGPRWRVLREAKYGRAEAFGRLELPPKFTGDLAGYRIHPALFDIATGFAMDLIDGYVGDALWVPVSYGKVRVFGPLPARIASQVRIRPVGSSPGVRRESLADFASFDVTLTDEGGNVLVLVTSLTLRKLAGTADFGGAKPLVASPAPTDRNDVSLPKTLSPAELAFVTLLQQGISPKEGCAAFDRVLAKVSSPVILVTSVALPALLAEAERASAVLAPTAKFARPELPSSFVAPRNEIERTLVGFWADLLGVSEVGVEDNFFDLGGHSLIAVRLFAKIKQAYRVDYPISILFEAPTIARCAELIRSTAEAPPEATRDAIDPHRTHLTHLVPMHPKESQPSSGRAPFFLVAGMFGNVLNLRHLAHLLGQERGFYGLQARGLYGDHTPHATFEAMAADYLAELRTVQAKGPYLLGGFSGGGITAYEMARQLLSSGEEVALLVLLDTPLPSSPPLTSRDRLMLHLERFRREGAGHVVDWVKRRYEWEASERRRRTEPIATKTRFDFHSETIEAAFRGALERYDLRALEVPVALFRPKLDVHAELGPGRVINRDRRFIYHDNGWSRFVPSVEVFEMPGDHDSMVLEPNVRVLSARLRECLERAEVKSPALALSRTAKIWPSDSRASRSW